MGTRPTPHERESAAFRPGELEGFVRIELDQYLDQVVNLNDPLTQIAFDLIAWTERTGSRSYGWRLKPTTLFPHVTSNDSDARDRLP